MTHPQPEPLSLAAKLPALPFTLRQLECFLAVADHGSVSAAADVLHASGSAVSDSITALERAIGATLFLRQRSRGTRITAEGSAILTVARRIVDEGAVLAATIGAAQSAIVGPVRVGATGTLASLFLPQIITEMRQRYPEVHVEIRTGDLGTLLDLADAQELDLVITYNLDMRPEYHRSVLTHTQAMVALAADHPLADRPAIELSELADEPMVLFDIAASRVHTLELMLNRGVTPRVAYRTTDYELCRSLVGRGLGYSLLMRRNIAGETWDGGAVRMVPVTPEPREVEVLVCWPREPVPPRVRAVIEVTEQVSEAAAQQFRMPSGSSTS